MTELTPVKKKEARNGFCAGFEEHNNGGLLPLKDNKIRLV
jgi:hypothetical protein